MTNSYILPLSRSLRLKQSNMNETNSSGGPSGSQSVASIQVTCSFCANQRPVSRSRDYYLPISTQYRETSETMLACRSLPQLESMLGVSWTMMSQTTTPISISVSLCHTDRVTAGDQSKHRALYHGMTIVTWVYCQGSIF